MEKYEKVIINGEPVYREFCAATGFYTRTFSEEALKKQLLKKSIHSVTEFNEFEIEAALSTLEPNYKKTVETYIHYLERVVESFEKKHDLR